jgi:hypothetical protein
MSFISANMPGSSDIMPSVLHRALARSDSAFSSKDGCSTLKGYVRVSTLKGYYVQ